MVARQPTTSSNNNPRETPAACPVGVLAAFGPWRLGYAGDGSGAGPTGTSAQFSMMASNRAYFSHTSLMASIFFIAKTILLPHQWLPINPTRAVGHRQYTGGRLNWGRCSSRTQHSISESRDCHRVCDRRGWILAEPAGA